MSDNPVEWAMAFLLMGVAVAVIAVYALTVRRHENLIDRKRDRRD